MEIVLSLLDGLLDSVYAIGSSLVLKNWHIQYKKETMKKLIIEDTNLIRILHNLICKYTYTDKIIIRNIKKKLLR